jgi:hypothetical protein
MNYRTERMRNSTKLGYELFHANNVTNSFVKGMYTYVCLYVKSNTRFHLFPVISSVCLPMGEGGVVYDREYLFNSLLLLLFQGHKFTNSLA